MALSGKVKTSLDETHTLMLGAQILLGFQFNGAFRPRFNALPPSARRVDTVGLGLMLVTVSLLVAPSAFHRIVDRGESTGRAQTVTSICAAMALVPFATALGLDLSIALSPALQSALGGILAGAGFALVSALAWFGMGWVMKTYYGGKERRKAEAAREAREAAPLHSRIEQMLTEARVILPGAQALFGFQLAVVLTEAFENLSSLPRLLHGVALQHVAIAHERGRIRSARGQADDIATLMRRTLIRTSAPIFNSLRRLVPQVESANCECARPMRRKAHSST